jgi:hypothetical protein
MNRRKYIYPQCLTVKELIKKLEQVDQESLVHMLDGDGVVGMVTGITRDYPSMVYVEWEEYKV